MKIPIWNTCLQYHELTLESLNNWYLNFVFKIQSVIAFWSSFYQGLSLNHFETLQFNLPLIFNETYIYKYNVPKFWRSHLSFTLKSEKMSKHSSNSQLRYSTRIIYWLTWARILLLLVTETKYVPKILTKFTWCLNIGNNIKVFYGVTLLCLSMERF